MNYDPGALYYAVTGQLEGYDDISDSVTEVIIAFSPDGTHKTKISLWQAAAIAGLIARRRHWQRSAG